MSLLFKALLGAAAVLLIAVLAKSRNYYLAGLVPLFPTFALIAHYVVGSEQSVDALRTTIVFGMWSLLPYFVYLVTLYGLVAHVKLPLALAGAACCWALSAALLVTVWTKTRA